MTTISERFSIYEETVYAPPEGYIKRIFLEDLNEKFTMVWVENPLSFDYLRKATYHSNTPKEMCSGRVIGYSEPQEIDRHSYQGIIFYLNERDRGMPKQDPAYSKEKGNRPCEAVTIVHRPSGEGG